MLSKAPAPRSESAVSLAVSARRASSGAERRWSCGRLPRPCPSTARSPLRRCPQRGQLSARLHPCAICPAFGFEVLVAGEDTCDSMDVAVGLIRACTHCGLTLPEPLEALGLWSRSPASIGPIGSLQARGWRPPLRQGVDPERAVLSPADPVGEDGAGCRPHRESALKMVSIDAQPQPEADAVSTGEVHGQLDSHEPHDPPKAVKSPAGSRRHGTYRCCPSVRGSGEREQDQATAT